MTTFIYRDAGVDYRITPEIMGDMRAWVEDCWGIWTDTEGFTPDDLTDIEIVEGVKLHYGGRLAGWFKDSEVLGTKEMR